MFGLIGPDGAGKTTTIRLLCGLLHADGGSGARARPRSGRASTARSRAAVGYLSQRFSLYGDLSIDENIAFFAEIHGVRDYQAAPRSPARDDAAHAVPARLADRLSGGMKQKLALACTLVHEPRAPPARRADDRRRSGVAARVLEAAVGVPRAGLTIVMATPYLDEAERCARVALLHEGRLLALDTPDHLRAQPARAASRGRSPTTSRVRWRDARGMPRCRRRAVVRRARARPVRHGAHRRRRGAASPTR